MVTPYERYLEQLQMVGAERATRRERPDIIGRGWRWPIGVDGRGRIATAAGTEKLEQSIMLILATGRNTRVRRPEFGSRLLQAVHRSNLRGAAPGAVAFWVREALEVWEPRIDVLHVDAETTATEPTQLIVKLQYRERATGDVRNRVFPFVVEEGGFLAPVDIAEPR